MGYPTSRRLATSFWNGTNAKLIRFSSPFCETRKPSQITPCIPAISEKKGLSHGKHSNTAQPPASKNRLVSSYSVLFRGAGPQFVSGGDGRSTANERVPRTGQPDPRGLGRLGGTPAALAADDRPGPRSRRHVLD